jgi:hypothetical protein
MRDAAAQPITLRLHAVISRLSRDGGYLAEQSDVAEGAARIVVLERALHALLDDIDDVSYVDTAGCRLSDATPAVANARTVLGEAPSSVADL